MGAPVLVVTPWYPVRGAGSPLDLALAAAVSAVAAAGADVTVVHLVGRDDETDDETADEQGPVIVRRVRIDGELVPGDPQAVDGIAAALAHGVADLLGAAAVVHAHSAVPVAAAVTRVLPEQARLVVSEHLASALPLLAGADATREAWDAVMARADVVLAPSEDLVRRLAGHSVPAAGGEAPQRQARIELAPYALPVPGPHPTEQLVAASGTDGEGAGELGALPRTRWLLLGPPSAAGLVVRTLAADALAGAPTTLTLALPSPLDGEELQALAARLGVEQRVIPLSPQELAGRLARGRLDVDLVIAPDPSSVADPALPAALVAGIPAVIARSRGPEEVLDEVAATGALRFVPADATVPALLEAVADLRRAQLGSAESREIPRPGRSLLAPWRTSTDSVARRLTRQYGDVVTSPATSAPAVPWPRVLLADLSGTRRNDIGRLARWVAAIGGEPVVVNAAAPPPAAAVSGAVSIDLRQIAGRLARRPLNRVRRRLPRVARPALDGAVAAYRMVRRAPTLVDAALAGPLAPGVGPSPDVDAVVATADVDLELARRWTATRIVVPPDADLLVARLTALAPSRPGTVTDAGPTSSAETEGS